MLDYFCILHLNIILTVEDVASYEPCLFISMNQMVHIFFSLPPPAQLIPLKVEHGNTFFYISHIQNSLAALSEVQINPSEVEEYTLQILASNEV